MLNDLLNITIGVMMMSIVLTLLLHGKPRWDSKAMFCDTPAKEETQSCSININVTGEKIEEKMYSLSSGSENCDR